MEENFWHRKWKENDLGFHQTAVNPFLKAHHKKLGLTANSRIFVPLCGKTLDIHWLLANGYQVVGAELSQLAVEQLFAELKLKPQVKKLGELQRYQADNIEIFVGNIFNLSQQVLGQVDAIYDRAALIALTEDLRQHYSQHLMLLTDTAPQLLICVDYDQASMPGPPFAVEGTMVAQYYADHYQLTLLESETINGGLKGQTPATNLVWLLK